MLGTTLRGRYRIITRLGGGAFGETYLAQDEDLPGAPLRVVKHLKPKDPTPTVLPIAIRLFRNEAEHLYHLKHEQIPELFAYFEENGEFFLVQDYIDGDDLAKSELAPGKRLSEAEVTKLLQGILEVLAFLHQQDVIHRDIKPQNMIRRRQDGKLFLIDFGAVKAFGTLITTLEGQKSGTVPIGTHGYMPSEQASGQPQLSSDVYAVGIIGIQALTGIQPIQLPKDPKTLEIIWRDQSQVSSKLANILDKMVRYNFRQRYPSAVEALQAFKGSTASTSATILTSLSVRRRGGLIALITGVFAGLVAILIYFKPPGPSQPSLTEKYVNQNYGITISYPQEWEKQDNHDVFTKQVVEFISPENNSDSNRDKLIVTVEDLSRPQSLDEYTASAKKEILHLNRNAEILKEEESTLADNRAHRIVYTVRDGSSSLKRMEVWTLKNYKVYSVIYEAKADEYERDLSIAEAMTRSLQVATK